jgi:hypothetical protein
LKCFGHAQRRRSRGASACAARAPRVGICNFDIVCNLSIVIWDFSAVSGKTNSFYLNQLELTLTFPCGATPPFDIINIPGYKYILTRLTVQKFFKT